ncbi:hypothetical protein ACFU8W_47950 [Streptomyces sp. NPDC057565]|uniref:hypothetical protein n=1 Tax=Streptomyces sp. NPDC057565 TaxID=3346169 RepID=UPI0036791237
MTLQPIRSAERHCFGDLSAGRIAEPDARAGARRIGFHTDEGVVLLGRDGGGVLYRRESAIPTG